MKTITTFFLVFYSLVYAYSKKELISDYQNKNFKKVCIDGAISDSKDEAILSLVGNACLKIDAINPLGIIVKRLVSTPKYRENASYFATILLQKKLIYQFMNDGIDLKSIRLPRTSNILSVVFENIIKKNYRVIDRNKNKIEISIGNKKYILWRSNDNPPKVFIDEYKDGILLKTHWYL
ncbi:MAG: hypothetical protein QM482_09700 [Sulfurospirillum sp.]